MIADCKEAVKKRVPAMSIGLIALIICVAGKPELSASTQAPASVVPIVNGYGLLLGGTHDGKWLTWKQTHSRLRGGEAYRFFSLKGAQGESKGGKPTLSEASGLAYTIPLFDRKAEEGGGVIGVGGGWKPRPRSASAVSAGQKVYVDAVATVLREHGLTKATPRIVRAIRADLTGTGQDSVIIEAASPGFSVSDGIGTVKANTYSFVMLRTLVNGTVKTFVLNGEFARRTGAGPAQKYAISNALDLNGDGVLEIVIETSYYEGGGNEVYELKKGRPRLVLSAADGA